MAIIQSEPLSVDDFIEQLKKLPPGAKIMIPDAGCGCCGSLGEVIDQTTPIEFRDNYVWIARYHWPEET